jgi:hypothetical protein
VTKGSGCGPGSPKTYGSYRSGCDPEQCPKVKRRATQAKERTINLLTQNIGYKSKFIPSSKVITSFLTFRKREQKSTTKFAKLVQPYWRLEHILGYFHFFAFAKARIIKVKLVKILKILKILCMIESTCKAGLRKHPLLLPFQQDRLCFAILYVSVSEKNVKK